MPLSLTDWPCQCVSSLPWAKSPVLSQLLKVAAVKYSYNKSRELPGLNWKRKPSAPPSPNPHQELCSLQGETSSGTGTSWQIWDPDLLLGARTAVQV